MITSVSRSPPSPLTTGANLYLRAPSSTLHCTVSGLGESLCGG